MKVSDLQRILAAFPPDAIVAVHGGREAKFVKSEVHTIPHELPETELGTEVVWITDRRP
jgi:hypothetical protein